MSTALAVHHGPFGRVALYSLDRGMVLHAHREGHLIFHVQGPDAAIRIEDATYPLAPSHGVAISPFQAHNYISLDATEPSVFLTLYIRPSWFLEASRQVNGSLRFGRCPIEVTAPLGRLARQTALALLHDEDDEVVSGNLHELTQISFDQSWQWTGGPTLTVSTRPTRDFRVRTSVRLMQDRLCDQLALDDIARESGLSRPHFYKLFREQVGVPPNMYMNTLRMEAAITRLTGGLAAVTDIGLDLGFASQASFTRFFIANVGIAPSDYRRVVRVAGRA
jgi:AraC-like DNA-binding protein